MTTKFSISVIILIACLFVLSLPLTEVSAQISDRPAQRLPALLNQTTMKTQTTLATPKFTTKIPIKANGNAMKVDTYDSVPCVVDWNEDGRKDLLVGCFYDGNVYLFINSGTDTVPVFTTGVKLKADSQEISVAYG